jgi:hypothetical protein
MAQAIFKSWFVDFELFGGVMPDDWREVPLGEVVEMSTKALNPQSCPDTIFEHYSIPAFDETRLPVFEAASEIKSNKYIVDKGCFLISKLNPTTKRIWRPYCISSHPVCSTEFMVYRAKNPAHKDFYFTTRLLIAWLSRAFCCRTSRVRQAVGNERYQARRSRLLLLSHPTTSLMTSATRLRLFMHILNKTTLKVADCGKFEIRFCPALYPFGIEIRSA